MNTNHNQETLCTVISAFAEKFHVSLDRTEQRQLAKFLDKNGFCYVPVGGAVLSEQENLIWQDFIAKQRADAAQDERKKIVRKVKELFNLDISTIAF